MSPTKGEGDRPLLLYHGESTPTSFDGEVHRLPLRADSGPVPIQDGQSCCVFHVQLDLVSRPHQRQHVDEARRGHVRVDRSSRRQHARLSPGGDRRRTAVEVKGCTTTTTITTTTTTTTSTGRSGCISSRPSSCRRTLIVVGGLDDGRMAQYEVFSFKLSKCHLSTPKHTTRIHTHGRVEQHRWRTLRG